MDKFKKTLRAKLDEAAQSAPERKRVMLYLDPDGSDENGSGLYLPMLQACYDRMKPGSLVLAHNSINAAPRLESYLQFVRDEANCQASVNIMLDGEGYFEIEGVPAGPRSLVVAHNGAAEEYPVTIKTGEIADMGEIRFIVVTPSPELQ